MRGACRGAGRLWYALVWVGLVGISQAGCTTPPSAPSIPVEGDGGAGGGGGGGGADGGVVSPPDAQTEEADAGPPPALGIDHTTRNFGAVVVDTAATDATLMVTNTGGAVTGKLAVSLTGASSGYVRKTDTCDGMTLAAGAQCQITIGITPTSLGTLPGAVMVTATPGGTVMAALTVKAITPALLTIDATTHDFGQVTAGATGATSTFTITNTGQEPSGVVTTGLSGTDSTQFMVHDACTGQTLMELGTCQVTVAFAPTMSGSRTAALAVSATPGGTVTASLSGIGQNPPLLTVAPVVGTFASTVIGKVSPSVSFVVSNAADVAAGSTTALTLSIQGSDAGDFQLPTNGCGATLASKSSCTATIVFIPLDLGMRTATLMVTATPGGSFSVPLAGVGQGP